MCVCEGVHVDTMRMVMCIYEYILYIYEYILYMYMHFIVICYTFYVHK